VTPWRRTSRPRCLVHALPTTAAGRGHPSARRVGAPMENVLAAVGVRQRFGALLVLDDVDFAVAAGDAIGIVGPNGAGKTTLLNVLAGSLRPTAGRVELGGVDVTSVGAAKRCRLGIGRAHQVPRPFGDMTVFENVFVGAASGAGHRGRHVY